METSSELAVLGTEPIEPGVTRGRFRLSAHIWIVCLFLLAAVACRIIDLGKFPLWSDEAESSINALTILERGFPADSFQGQPLYENWMARSWPDNPEYEFRDISYSERHMAVYHAWLPLYAIALGFRLSGIAASPAGMLRPQYDAAERTRRTIAARAPSVFFGMLGILAFYLAGARLHSRDAGLIASFLAGFLSLNIWYSQTARYYAATAAVITFCIWAVLAMRQSARWRDFLIGSFLFSLLFYTHLLAFAVACLMWTVAMASQAKHWRLIGWRVTVFAAGIAALCTPWLIGTGFIGHNSQIPRAWRMLSIPADLILLLRRFLFSEFGLVLIGGVILAGAANVLNGRASIRWTAPLQSFRRAFAFPYLWLVLTYLVFFACIPAPSFSVSRLSLVLMPAALLVIAMVCCSLAEIASKRNLLLLAFVGATAFLLTFNWRHPHNVRLANLGLRAPADIVAPMHYIDGAMDYLRAAPVDRSTRLFAAPDLQLVLTFYSGMFVQSIVPVRKEYLDSWAGDIIFFSSEAFWRTGPLRPDRLNEAARNAGVAISSQDASDLSCRLSSLDFRSRQAQAISHVLPPVSHVPSFAAGLWRQQHEQWPEWFHENYRWFSEGFLLFRNSEIRDSSDWWLQYFYALADPEQRRNHPNYETRIRNSTLTVLPCADLVVYYSPGNRRKPG
jgi:hypothetical protein